MQRRVKEKDFLSLARKKGRPNFVDEKMLQKIRDVITGSRLAGTVTSSKMVIAIGTAVIKAKEQKNFKKFGGSLELTENWAQNVLKNMDWVRRKRITEKVEPCAMILKEEKFSSQHTISKFVSEHDIPLYLVLNLDQIPLSYVSPSKYTHLL